MQKPATLILILGIGLIPSLRAGETELTGPMLGVAFDSTAAAFRPMRGIPGAATLGAPFALDFTPAAAVVSPAQFALAVRDSDGVVMTIRTAGDALSSEVLPGARTFPDLIAFSADGKKAALYFAGDAQIQVFEGLPDSPRLATEADVSGIGVRLLRIALSPIDCSLVAAAQDADSQALYLLPPAADARRLGVFNTVSALAFTGGGKEILIADSQANAVYRVAANSAESVLIASEKDGLAHPVDVTALPNGRVLIADDKSGAVFWAERDGGPPVAIQCGCNPTGLSRLSGTSVFRLTDPAAGAVWILDSGGDELRVLVVPALVGGAE